MQFFISISSDSLQARAPESEVHLQQDADGDATIFAHIDVETLIDRSKEEEAIKALPKPQTFSLTEGRPSSVNCGLPSREKKGIAKRQKTARNPRLEKGVG